MKHLALYVARVLKDRLKELATREDGSLWDRPYSPTTGAAQSAAQTGLSVQAQGNVVLPTSFAVTSSTETVVPNPQNSAAPLIIPIPPNQPSLEQTAFDIIATGYLKTTASGSVTLKLYSGTSLTVGNDTQLATSGAVTQNTATAPFEFHIHGVYDSVSGKLGGWFEGFINNTLIARAALSNVLTGLSNATNPVMSLLLSLTSSGATAGTPTTLNLQKFSAG
jgi:hypothetical protein